MKYIFVLLALLLIFATASCSEVVLQDISDTPDAKAVIGTQYEVIGAVDAYGVRQHSKADVEYITLIPPPGVAGSEVGFRVRLVPGSKITIEKVMESNYWFDPNTTFIVSVEGTSMPVAATTRIEMFRGNEGSGHYELNPNIYRKIGGVLP